MDSVKRAVIKQTYRARDIRGRYDYENLDLICVCGHKLSVHAGINDSHLRPCLNSDPEDGDGEECNCENFKLKKQEE